MIKLIVGNKGSGKTKTLINLANEAVKSTDGSVIVVEQGLKLTYDINHQARLVDVERYSIAGFESYYGFISGLLAGNYDITDIFCDQALSIGGRDFEQFAVMIDKLATLTENSDITLTMLVSCDISELPERIQKFAI